MPKVEAIINEIENKIQDNLPEVTHVLESDIERLLQALKKQKNDKSYYAILRYVLSEVKRILGHKDYINPLMQIGLGQLQGKNYIYDLKLKICQAIIDCQQYHRINFLEHTVNALTDANLKDPLLRARLQVVRAGKQFLKGDFTKASMFYLNASREEGFVKDDQKKLFLINKAIAFSYVASRSHQNHKNICSLCLNQLSKKSHLKEVLNKLYMQDMMTVEDCQKVQKQLPSSLNEIDIDGVSVLQKAKFSHNMIPIINSFTTIYFNTLSQLLGMNIDQVLILLEKTYSNGQIKIDQQQQLIQFKSQHQDYKQRLKQFLNKIDQILVRNQE